MFNIFGSKPQKSEPESEEESDIIASITYLVKKNEDGVSIDVSLEDFEDQSIEGICEILEILGNDSCYIDTINIIKGLFINENRHDILVKIFSRIDSNVREKIINSAKNRLKDQPCIKPSEVFR